MRVNQYNLKERIERARRVNHATYETVNGITFRTSDPDGMKAMMEYKATLLNYESI